LCVEIIDKYGTDIFSYNETVTYVLVFSFLFDLYVNVVL